VDPWPGAPEHDDQGRQAMAVPITASLAHDGDDLVNCRRVRGVGWPLLRGATPARNPGMVAGALSDVDLGFSRPR
jgi:hypothetical protein